MVISICVFPNYADVLNSVKVSSLQFQTTGLEKSFSGIDFMEWTSTMNM